MGHILHLVLSNCLNSYSCADSMCVSVSQHYHLHLSLCLSTTLSLFLSLLASSITVCLTLYFRYIFLPAVPPPPDTWTMLRTSGGMPTFWQLTYIFAQPQMTSLHALALEQVLHCPLHCEPCPSWSWCMDSYGQIVKMFIQINTSLL
jgi:hypothetical protein